MSLLSRLEAAASGHKGTDLLQLLAVTVQAVILPMALARYVIVARTLGPTNYGLLGLVVALGGILAALPRLGLSVAATRESAAIDDPTRVSKIALVLVTARVTLTAPLLIALLFVAGPAASTAYALPAIERLSRIYAVALLFSSPQEILNGVLTGRQLFGRYFLLKLGNEIVLTSTTIYLVLSQGIDGVFIAQAVTAFVYTSALTVSVNGKLRGRDGERRIPTLHEAREIVRLVTRVTIGASLVGFLRTASVQGPILYAGLFVPPAVIGLFRFALQMASQFNSIVAPALNVVLPRFTAIKASLGSEGVVDRLRRTFRRVSLGTAILLVPVILLARELVTIVGGGDFAASAGPAIVLICYYATYFLAGNIFGAIHVPYRREVAWAFAYGSAFVVTMSMTAILVPMFRTPMSIAVPLLVGGGVLLALGVRQVKWLDGLSPRLSRDVLALGLVVAPVAAVGLLAGALVWRGVTLLLALVVLGVYTARQERPLIVRVLARDWGVRVWRPGRPEPHSHERDKRGL